MILVVIYCGAGLYLLLMAAGLLHREYVKRMPGAGKAALVLIGGGLLVVGSYYAWYYYYRTTEEGKQLIKMQEELEKGQLPPSLP
ncbi:MAG: hypothetical protein HY042_04375 [Spirochaetia bacterium]|nr:hypothetical protein [Spirochaetia bacterium]